MVRVQVPYWEAPLDCTLPEYNEFLEDDAARYVVDRTSSARQPLILVDGFAARFGAREEINLLARLTGFPVLTAPSGKGLIDEDLPSFCGVFTDMAGTKEEKNWVSNCDLVLHFGPLKSDVNTFGPTALPETRSSLVFDRYTVTDDKGAIPARSLPGNRLHVKSLLRKVLASLNKSRIPTFQIPYPGAHPSLQVTSPIKDRSAIFQRQFWPRISQFFRSGDVIVTETGTSAHGGQSFVLPPRTTLVNCCIWLSIGHMLGACQGIALAQRDNKHSSLDDTTIDNDTVSIHPQPFCPGGRTIMFVGDGSLQMSAQIISDIIRNRFDVTIFVLNNSGYTIERIIHGFHASYNDVQPWRNLRAPEYFGAPENDASYPVRTRLVRSWDELETTVTDVEIQGGEGLNMIEVVMREDDAPESLQKFVAHLQRRNNGECS